MIDYVFRCDVCDERRTMPTGLATPPGWFLLVCSAGANHHACGAYCLAKLMERDHDDCAAPPLGQRH